MSWEEMRYFEQAPLKERKKIVLMAIVIADALQTEQLHADRNDGIFQNGPLSALSSPTVLQRVQGLADQTLTPTSLEAFLIAAIAGVFHSIESS
ncbi:MAG: hypothetical protein OXI35_04250 [Gemmatimonadota bacterium]|nr:hypothetical protein [Gemmatimonadota bacterium]